MVLGFLLWFLFTSDGQALMLVFVGGLRSRAAYCAVIRRGWCCVLPSCLSACVTKGSMQAVRHAEAKRNQSEKPRKAHEEEQLARRRPSSFWLLVFLVVAAWFRPLCASYLCWYLLVDPLSFCKCAFWVSCCRFQLL